MTNMQMLLMFGTMFCAGTMVLVYIGWEQANKIEVMSKSLTEYKSLLSHTSSHARMMRNFISETKQLDTFRAWATGAELNDLLAPPIEAEVILVDKLGVAMKEADAKLAAEATTVPAA